MAIAAAEAGKSPEQSDPEISEAIDFACYARRAMELDEVDGARFLARSSDRRRTAVELPHRDPRGRDIRRPGGRRAVIHKPAAPTPRCAMAVLEAPVGGRCPRECASACSPTRDPRAKRLLSHPQVDRSS